MPANLPSIFFFLRVCVYAGSNPGSDPAYADGARALARGARRARHGLVFGGGKVGLIGVVADAVAAAGGKAIGVMPQALIDHEIGHRGLTELRIVNSMHERKGRWRISRTGSCASGRAGHPRGTLRGVHLGQLGFHAKPCGLVNVNATTTTWPTFLDHAVDRGLPARSSTAPCSRVARIPPSCWTRIAASRTAPSVGKWLELEFRPDPAAAHRGGQGRADAVPRRRPRSRPGGTTARRGRPHATVRSIAVDDRVAGLIPYGEETEPDYRHAGSTSSSTPRSRPRARRGRGGHCSTHLIDERGHHRSRSTRRPPTRRDPRLREGRLPPVGVMRAYGRDMAAGDWHDGLLMELVERRPKAAPPETSA